MNDSKKEETVMIEKIINVKGMTCGGCVNSVKRSLQALHGVQTVDVNLSSGEVNVSYDEETMDVGTLKAAIEEAGYEVIS